MINEKRLRVDILSLMEMIERKEFEMNWIQSNQQQADVLKCASKTNGRNNEM